MNLLEKTIDELRERIKELEDELKEWEDKPAPYDDYEEMGDAIYKFCCDCSVGTSSNCVLCYLNRWKMKPE